MTIDTLRQLLGRSDLPDWVWTFQHAPGTRVRFGPGVVRQAGDCVREMGCQHVLVVTDPGVARCGHLQTVVDSLEARGIECSLFDQVIENPTTETVEACLSLSQAYGIDGYVAIGGGSSMDTAKGTNFLYTNGGRMADYWGKGKATKDMLPLLVIPTTAGTGSECQSFALISDAQTHQKMACGDPKAAARWALLDPELTLTQPPRVAALTAIDALTHALESAVCRARTEISLAYSKAAFYLLAEGWPRVLANPHSLEARGMVQVGAALAGVAIENSMLGAAHSAANPLTAHFDLPHGQAVGVMMPHVLRHNIHVPEAAATYRELLPNQDPAAWFTDVLQASGLATSLRDCGISPERLASVPTLASEAARQWTAQFNPAPVTEAHFAALYQAAL